MSIVKNMWMRNTRQQVAGAVLYNLKGQTIQREKAGKLFNPRTTAQMDQRVKLANLVNFYRANKAWMAKGAFESKKQTWSDYNAFVSVNLKTSLVYLTKTQASAGACVCAPYIVTKGTLPSVNITTEELDENKNYIIIALSASAAPTTWGALSKAIIDQHPGIQNGDQLSIIYYMQKDGVNDPFLRVKAQELILDVNSTDALTDLFPRWTIGQNAMEYQSHDVDEGLEVGISVCFSRTVAGKIKVSDSEVIMLDLSKFNDATDAGVAQNAIESYGGSTIHFLDSNTMGLSSAPSGSSGGSGGGSGSGDPGDVTP